MPRKTFVDLSDTINAFRTKVNVISYNVGDLDSLNAGLSDSDLVQAINSMHDDVLGNDSDILAIKNFIGFDSATSSSGSLTGQISGNDSDIAALNASLNTSIGTVNANNVRTVNLAILRSNGTVVKRIFGYTDSGV